MLKKLRIIVDKWRTAVYSKIAKKINETAVPLNKDVLDYTPPLSKIYSIKDINSKEFLTD